MIDLAQHFLINADLSVLHTSAIDFASSFHFNLADIHSHINMDLVAQQFKQDVAGDFARGWDDFVKSGRIWALIIGVVVGYMFRSITNA